ncbi:MAG: twin-arginine translocation signal domain-containing protein, partial [Casimicrobiaceae bacterium]
MTMNRRSFLRTAGLTAVAAGVVTRAGAASLPEAATMGAATTQPPLVPDSGHPYNPVVTLNGWTLPWRMTDGTKEFHLVAEPVEREIAPGMIARLWGYNGQ